MNSTHLHLILNHIPILGSVFCLLLLGIGMLLKNKTIEIVALSTLLVVSLFTLPAFLSGEGAEHAVELLAGVSEHELEEHEEHAEITLWLMIVCGLLSAMTLGSFKYLPHYTKWMRLVTFILLALTFVSTIPLALHGGKIIRPNLRGDLLHSASKS